MAIDISRALKDLRRNLNRLEREQVPFAEALALTRIAGKVGEQETRALPEVFDNPTPFTRKTFAIKAATKRMPLARVFAKDVQARYLEAHNFGGVQFLGSKRGILSPRSIRLNAYGNIPKGKLAGLKTDPDVFFGPVTFKSKGTVHGVWRRPPRGTQRGGGRGTKGSTAHKSTANAGLKKRTGLQLLVQFTDPAPVEPTFNFEPRARKVVEAVYATEFAAALDQAMATRR